MKRSNYRTKITAVCGIRRGNKMFAEGDCGKWEEAGEGGGYGGGGGWLEGEGVRHLG